jgi:hypothetical protein
MQLRKSDLIVLSVPPRIAWEVARQLKLTTQAPISVPLRHDEFYEYGVQMELFRGTLFFMGGWEDMAMRLGLRKNDIIGFELDVNCFNFTLIRATSSIQPLMKCKCHGLTVAKTNAADN